MKRSLRKFNLLTYGLITSLMFAPQAHAANRLAVDHPVHKLPLQERMLCTIALEALGKGVATQEHKTAASAYRESAKRNGYASQWKQIDDYYKTTIGGSKDAALKPANTCVMKLDPGYILIVATPLLPSAFECVAGGQSVTKHPKAQARLEFDLLQFLDQAGSTLIAHHELIERPIKTTSSIKDFGPKQDEYMNCATKYRRDLVSLAYQEQLDTRGPMALDWIHIKSSESARGDLLCAALAPHINSANDLMSSTRFKQWAKRQTGEAVKDQEFWKIKHTAMSNAFLQELSEWVITKIKDLPQSSTVRMAKHCAAATGE